MLIQNLSQSDGNNVSMREKLKADSEDMRRKDEEIRDLLRKLSEQESQVCYKSFIVLLFNWKLFELMCFIVVDTLRTVRCLWLVTCEFQIRQLDSKRIDYELLAQLREENQR